MRLAFVPSLLIGKFSRKTSELPGAVKLFRFQYGISVKSGTIGKQTEIPIACDVSLYEDQTWRFIQ